MPKKSSKSGFFTAENGPIIIGGVLGGAVLLLYLSTRNQQQVSVGPALTLNPSTDADASTVANLNAAVQAIANNRRNTPVTGANPNPVPTGNGTGTGGGGNPNTGTVTPVPTDTQWTQFLNNIFNNWTHNIPVGGSGGGGLGSNPPPSTTGPGNPSTTPPGTNSNTTPSAIPNISTHFLNALPGTGNAAYTANQAAVNAARGTAPMTAQGVVESLRSQGFTDSQIANSGVVGPPVYSLTAAGATIGEGQSGYSAQGGIGVLPQSSYTNYSDVTTAEGGMFYTAYKDGQVIAHIPVTSNTDIAALNQQYNVGNA